MKRYLFFVVVMAIFTACTNNKPNNIIRIDNGYAELTNLNDTTQFQRILDNDKRLVAEKTISKGKLIGAYKEFYSNGSLRSECVFVNGIKHGPAKWYYEDGKPFRIATIKEGKFDGEMTKYYPEGIKQSVSVYKNGRLLPGLKEFDKAGNVIVHQENLVLPK